MAAAQWVLDRARGREILEAAPEVAKTKALVTYTGRDISNASCELLVRAEFAAAKAGFGSMIDTPSGPAILETSLGAALEKIDRAPPHVRIPYLAAHGAVANLHATARQGFEYNCSPSTGCRKNAVGGAGPVVEIGGVPHDEYGNPLLIAVVLLAGAALIVGAVYATVSSVTSYFEVRAEAGRDMYIASLANDLALSGKPLDPAAMAVLDGLAKKGITARAQQGPGGLPWPLIIGGTVAVVAGAVFLPKMLERRR